MIAEATFIPLIVAIAVFCVGMIFFNMKKDTQ